MKGAEGGPDPKSVEKKGDVGKTVTDNKVHKTPVTTPKKGEKTVEEETGPDTGKDEKKSAVSQKKGSAPKTTTLQVESPKSGSPASNAIGSGESGFPELKDADGLEKARKVVDGSPKWNRHISHENVKEFYKFMNLNILRT